jgi:uncharacterized membrane protein YraQ (UPF0718 family)
MTDKNDFGATLKKTWKSFRFSLPIIFSVLLVVAFVQSIVPEELYSKIFTGNIILDPIIGAIFGSISIGNPIVSYVIADGLLTNGVSHVAITAFIVAWVSVGIIQLPAESYYLGKRFAFVRNLTSFIGAILIGIIINFLL